jgi:hypothetical protein
LHAWQAGQELLLQQVLSTQFPEAHSVPPAQDAPLLFFVDPQDPAAQLFVTQSALPEQLVLHVRPSLAQIRRPGQA